MKLGLTTVAFFVCMSGCGDDTPTEPQRFPEFRDRSEIDKPPPAASANGRAQAEPFPSESARPAEGGVSFQGAEIPDGPSTESMNDIAQGTATDERSDEDADADIQSTTGQPDADPAGIDSDNEEEAASAQMPTSPNASEPENTPSEEDDSSLDGRDPPPEDDRDADDDSSPEETASSEAGDDQPGTEPESELNPNESQFADSDMDDTFTQRIQRGLSGLCVEALCHASTNNLTNLENINQLIGVQARGTAALYIAPGSKEESYLYNVMLPANQRSVAVLGTQMPPRRAGITDVDIAQFRSELGLWIDNLEQ